MESSCSFPFHSSVSSCGVLCCVLPSCVLLCVLCVVLYCVVGLFLAAAECIAIDLEMTGIPDFETNTKADSPSMRYLECCLMSHFSISILLLFNFLPASHFSICQCQVSFLCPLSLRHVLSCFVLSGIKNAPNKFPNTV
jgi:hypothetical protein